MKFNSGYFTRLVSARNSDSTEGFFSNVAGIFVRRKESGQQYAVNRRTAQRLERRGGGIPLNQRRIGSLCQNGALNVGIVIAVQAQQVEGALQRRQRWVKRRVFRIAAAKDAPIAAL